MHWIKETSDEMSSLLTYNSLKSVGEQLEQLKQAQVIYLWYIISRNSCSFLTTFLSAGQLQATSKQMDIEVGSDFKLISYIAE